MGGGDLGPGLAEMKTEELFVKAELEFHVVDVTSASEREEDLALDEGEDMVRQIGSDLD